MNSGVFGLCWVSLSLFLSPDNVKAYYRRAKAHVGAWNPDDAKRDFQKCLELDKTLTKSVQHDLEQLNQEIKLNDVETKMRYKNLFSWARDESTANWMDVVNFYVKFYFLKLLSVVVVQFYVLFLK